ncbi:MAG: 30S ribosomal protein S16 [bacterium]|nr:30S ribosomal protein S16 [bacterium]
MVKIRLFRTGKTNSPYYRVVVMDSRSPRNGKYIDNLGTYDPRGGKLELDSIKAQEWIKKGAQPTVIVSKLLKRKEAN